MHIYSYKHIHIYTYIYISLYIYIYIYIYMCVCLCVRVCLHRHLHHIGFHNMSKTVVCNSSMPSTLKQQMILVRQRFDPMPRGYHRQRTCLHRHQPERSSKYTRPVCDLGSLVAWWHRTFEETNVPHRPPRPPTLQTTTSTRGNTTTNN